MLITYNLSLLKLVTNALAPFGLMATPKGNGPSTRIVLVIVFVAVLITLTVFANKLGTYSSFPFGVIVIQLGLSSTGIESVTVFVVVSITLTAS